MKKSLTARIALLIAKLRQNTFIVTILLINRKNVRLNTETECSTVTGIKKRIRKCQLLEAVTGRYEKVHNHKKKMKSSLNSEMFIAIRSRILQNIISKIRSRRTRTESHIAPTSNVRNAQ